MSGDCSVDDYLEIIMRLATPAHLLRERGHATTTILHMAAHSR